MQEKNFVDNDVRMECTPCIKYMRGGACVKCFIDNRAFTSL